MTAQVTASEPAQTAAPNPTANPTPKRRKADTWPKQIRAEDCRIPVTVYRRCRASGKVGFQVVNYSDGGGRVLESFEDEADATERAKDLSRLLSNRQSLAANLSNEDAVSFNAARELLDPAGLPLLPTIQTAVEAVRLVGGLANVLKACGQYAKRHGVHLEPKPVSEAVEEFVAERKANGCGLRYVQDLNDRLGRFADTFQCEVAGVTGDAIQTWLDGLKIGPQSRINYRRVLNAFFGFCQRRGWLPKSWDELERLAPVKVRNNGEVSIYTPQELRWLLAAASSDFLPVLVIQAFCGLRSAEVERLEWSDINLSEGHVTVGATASKTGSRRIVPLCTAARAWLGTEKDRKGKVWKRGHQPFYHAQQDTAAATAHRGQKAVEWKHNALRHSFVSYRLAETGDAARTAFEAGNSATMVHRHYKSLVTAKAAKAWFAMKPAKPANVSVLKAA